MAKPQQPEIAREGDTGPVPEDNQPGHHPEIEQDKPTGEAFLRKVQEHARDRDEPDAHDQPPSDEPGPPPTIAGDALRAAAGAVRKVRESLPGD